MSDPLLTIKLIGLVQGIPSEFDGQYVVEYEPHRWADNVIGAHLVTTSDRTKALQLPAGRAQALWAMSRGTRPDGKPDRPLTAFTAQIERLG